MQNFKTIYFDIVGFCNAKCPYCHSGTNRIRGGNKINTGRFKQALLKLLEKKIITRGAVISLYSWGEPFLHPEIHSIVDCINELGVKYAISTNASRVPSIDRNFIKNLNHVIFSMPGFSQESYGRVHGFNFENIIQNIVKIVKDCRKFDFNGNFVISYHVYKFNVEEIKKCEQFANDHGIVFRPYYAILNHWWILQNFINNRLPKNESDRISEDLFNSENIEKKMGESPKNYLCPQFDFLVIDENANIVTCCQVPGNHGEYSCGNILETDIETILNTRKNRQLCSECMSSGLAFYLNNSMGMPDFYKRSAKQKVLVLRQRIKRIKNLSLSEVLKRFA